MKVNVFIDYEDLFWNLVITLKENGIPINEVPVSLVNEYLSILMNNSSKQNINVRYTLDDKTRENFLKNKSRYYKYNEINNSFILLEGRRTSDIIMKHQVCLPSYVLKSIYDSNVIIKTLEAYANILTLSTKEEVKKIKKKTKNKKK